MERKFILDLCGGTGSWSKPYIEAGYDVRIVDLLTTGEDVRLLHLPQRQVHGILAAPPCTNFAASGARYWQRKGNAALLESLAVVDACLRYMTVLKPQWWALENPEGRLRSFLGPPIWQFHPHEFGHPYAKKTLLWGRFQAPIKQPPVEVVAKWGQHDCPRADRALRRSMTFSGFAKAFFEANP
jgi:hypothetical protein